MTDHLDVRAGIDADTHRSISLSRIGQGRFRADNGRGGETFLGSGGADPDFTPVELLLAAIAGCAALNVESITSKRVSSTRFEVTCSGEKAADESGKYMNGLQVTFDLAFPEGPEGEAASSSVARALQQTRDRLCTVSRTVERGEPVEYRDANG